MVDVPREICCKQVVELVNDYLEGALPFEERTCFERHLADCEGCTEYVRQLRQLSRAATRLREEGLPANMREGLLEAFRNWKKAAK